MTGEPDPRCKAIQELRVRRNGCLRMRIRIDNASLAILRRVLGESPEAARDPNSRSQRLWSALLAGRAIPAQELEGAADVLDELVANLQSRKPQQARIDALDAEMAPLARKLPVFAWVAGVRGFSERGLAAIVGETGDLALYPNFRHVWKRLGLMPWNGHAGSQCGNIGLSNQEWKEFGYVARRRAVVRAYVEEALFKHQIESAAKSATPFGRPKGPYGEVYVRRREFTAVARPDWTKGHAKDDATRLMAKALISDLWLEWRGKHTRQLDARGRFASPADFSHAADAGGLCDAAE